MWRSPVAQGVWDAKVAGSNPATPTIKTFILIFGFSLLIMSFVIALGAFLGFIGLEPVRALLAIAVVLVAKGFFDVQYCHLELFKRPSPFLHYCKNLMDRNEDVSGAALTYLLQWVLFGMLVGGGMYALVSYLS